MIAANSQNATDTALLIVRVALGLTLAAHGYFKFFKGGKIAGTARWFDGMGMRPGKVHAVLAATTELGAGTLFALGLLTPLAAAGFIGLMIVAAYTQYRDNGFFSANDGWEYNFVLGLVPITIATIGPGRFSLDRVLKIDDDLSGWIALLLFGGIGIAAGIAQLLVFYRPPAPDAS